MKKFAVILCLFLNSGSSATALEVYGLFTFDHSTYSHTPASFRESGDGIGYGFFARLEAGLGQIESGFSFATTSLTTSEPYGSVKSYGSFWEIPILYRWHAIPELLSLAAGPDYAIAGYNRVTVDGNEIGDNFSSGYRSHFGFEADLQSSRSMGESVSVVLDVRYRMGLADAITLNRMGMRYQTLMFSLGLLKRLE